MSHEFISFKVDLRQLPFLCWIDLGEIKSKCQHLAQVPLQPDLAKQLHQLYLAKGVHATTAIEGNTLTEQQVLLQVTGELDLPPSREYQRQEVQNIIDILNDKATDIVPGHQYILQVADILQIHRNIFRGMEVDSHVLPGSFRRVGVGVGDYGAPEANEVENLMSKLCEWLNRPDFVSSNEELKIPMAIIRSILAHIYIAWIHPFGDGNGRTARALELLILIGAGIPSPAAHLLSNHYHLTRTQYYRELQYASKSGGDVLKFIQYALNGFKEGVREQLLGVYEQLVRISMKDLIYESFKSSGLDRRQKPVVERRRRLALAFAKIERPATVSELRLEDVELALAYKDVSRVTLSNDLDQLVEDQWLIAHDGGKYQCNKNLILRFRPRSGLPMAISELPLES